MACCLTSLIVAERLLPWIGTCRQAGRDRRRKHHDAVSRRHGQDRRKHLSEWKCDEVTDQQLIVLDNAALEENNKFTALSSDIQSPRGLRGYTLIGGDASGLEVHWKVQGNIGGWTNYPDRVRSIYNTGGLAGEREGWHLPGFDDSGWQGGKEGLSAPGVRFYRAELSVHYPKGLDLHYR